MENLREFESYNLNENYYDRDRLYSKDFIVKQLSKAPADIRKCMENLPTIQCKDSAGNNKECTKIPEIVFNWLYGKKY